jgi:hypothetical protein
MVNTVSLDDAIQVNEWINLRSDEPFGSHQRGTEQAETIRALSHPGSTLLPVRIVRTHNH